MVVRALLDLIWPRVCEGCGGTVGDESRYFCWDCLAGLPLIESPFCARCGDPVEGAITHGYVCGVCVDREPGFDAARSAVRFRGPIKDALHRFKYSAATHLSHDLATVMHACVRTQYGREHIDAVTAVPLHALKERVRTYNQARLLASELSRVMKVPLARNCLARVRDTGTQTNLSARDRAKNVRGAFEARHPSWIEGRSILLVDDVMTTGATVSEASRVLKEAGAAKVFVITVARG